MPFLEGACVIHAADAPRRPNLGAKRRNPSPPLSGYMPAVQRVSVRWCSSSLMSQLRLRSPARLILISRRFMIDAVVIAFSTVLNDECRVNHALIRSLNPTR